MKEFEPTLNETLVLQYKKGINSLFRDEFDILSSAIVKAVRAGKSSTHVYMEPSLPSKIESYFIEETGLELIYNSETQ